MRISIRPRMSSRTRRTVSMSLPAGSFQFPVLVTRSWEDRAAAAHGDHDIEGLNRFGVQDLRV